jgi:exonuclease III
MGKVVANGTGRSCGVIILYNNDTFEAVSTETDIDGRYIIAILKDKKSDRLLLLTNIYAPNDFNESITFFNTVFDKIEGLKEAHVDENGLNANLEICLVGDFNFVVDETQCYKRLHTIQEKRLSRLVSNRLDTLSLIDTIGFDTDVAKHTWTARGICSRLDRIYCDQNLYNKIFALNKSWGVTKSDHASVSILFNQATYSRGPGIKGLKTVYLKNETFTSNIRQELQAWVENTPEAWDPHQKWEYCKVGLYTVASKQGTKYTSLQHVRKAELIKELTKLKLSIANESRPRFISITNQKIAALEYELNDIHEIEAESLFLQSGVKWREEGERSSKYFLGLVNKKRQETTVTQMYNREGVLCNSIQGILEIAKNFYEQLYRKMPTRNESELLDSFFAYSPKLSDAKANTLEERITAEELKNTLKTCKDSSPGPDGIPYSYYKEFEDILIEPLLKSWYFSLEKGELPPHNPKRA